MKSHARGNETHLLITKTASPIAVTTSKLERNKTDYLNAVLARSKMTRGARMIESTRKVASARLPVQRWRATDR